MTRALLQQALSALEWETGDSEDFVSAAEAITAIREYLAQPEQEPVAWIPDDALEQLAYPRVRLLGVPLITYGGEGHTPLYLHPKGDEE
jgi:hypothetical protein